MFNPISSASFRPSIVTTTSSSTSSTTANTQVPNSASSSVSNGSSNSLFSDITDTTAMSTNTNQSSHNLHLHQNQQQQHHYQQQQQQQQSSGFANFPSSNSPLRNGNLVSPDLQQQQQQSTQQIISGTGASTDPPSNPRISSKFTHHDIQILRQLLLAGEKHKWKQITKEINSSSNHSEHVAAAMTTGGASRTAGGIPPKNVSPTFVIKQYQQLLGLANHTAYFGSLGSSLPYVVNNWEGIEDNYVFDEN